MEQEATVTKVEMAKAFNEWMRRFIDEPERFKREFEEVGAFLAEEADGAEPSYGERCASYLAQVAGELVEAA